MAPPFPRCTAYGTVLQDESPLLQPQRDSGHPPADALATEDPTSVDVGVRGGIRQVAVYVRRDSVPNPDVDTLSDYQSFVFYSEPVDVRCRVVEQLRPARPAEERELPGGVSLFLYVLGQREHIYTALSLLAEE